MNPLEYLDTLENVQINKIQQDSKQEYTKDEVITLLKEIGLNYRKAIYNGEYILDIESTSEQHIKVNDTEYSIQKLLTHDNKSLLFLQVADVLDENFTDTDMEILAEEISKAAGKSQNIAGVMILPPNMNISLITAKLDTISYAKSLKIDEDEYCTINSLNDMINNAINSYTANTLYKRKSTSTSTKTVYDYIKY